MKEIIVKKILHLPENESVTREIMGHKFVGFVTGSANRIYAFECDDELITGEDIFFIYESTKHILKDIYIIEYKDDMYLVEATWQQCYGE